MTKRQNSTFEALADNVRALADRRRSEIAEPDVLEASVGSSDRWATDEIRNRAA